MPNMSQTPPPSCHTTRSLLAGAGLLLALGLGGCAWVPTWLGGTPDAPVVRSHAQPQEARAEAIERKELLLAITASHRLISFRADRPQELLSRVPLMGLLPGEGILGMDFRVARGELFALSTRGRLLRIDTNSGEVRPVGPGVKLPQARAFGFDFNPTVDRIRVVGDRGDNLRLHPDTGAQVDGQPDVAGVQPDGPLRYADGDAQAGSVPRIVAAGYTYNKDNEKITTNYAIDAQAGHLVMQGSPEGVTPVVSPNTGLLRTVGPLGVHAFDHASLDIDDVKNNAYLVTGRIGSTTSRLYVLDLKTGQAQLIGFVGPARERDRLGAVLAMAIQP
jgi:hypothetical protein